MIRAALLVLLVLLALSGCATSRPALEDFVRDPAPERVELEKTPFFPQDDYQCGPAALATLLQASGDDTRPEELVAEVYLPGRRGSLQTELVAAVRQRDRIPYVLAPTLDALLAELASGRPVLVLQNLGLESLPAWHFAVVIGYDALRNRLILRSGTVERLELSTGAFDRSWRRAARWAIVALKPDERPTRAELTRYIEAVAGLEAVGRLEAAETAYGVAAEIWPETALSYLGLGNVAYARGEYDRAVLAYREALRRAPNDVVARHNLAEALGSLGCIERARTEIAVASRMAAGTSWAEAVAASSARLAAQEPEQGSCREPPGPTP